MINTIFGTGNEIKVGIADMKMARREGLLITHALGSCVGICIYDEQIMLGALIHVMLPIATAGQKNVYKFADTGIKETLRKMSIFGGRPERYVCKIAGGAQMFNMDGGGSLGNIGARNVDSVKNTLRSAGINIKSQDTGGRCARTMFMDVGTGDVGLRMAGNKVISL